MRIAIIPARGGSKRIKRKNIKNFCGKPIIGWTIDIVRKSKIFISCHCGLTHAPNSFNIKIIDIIEKSKKEWYGRYTLYLKNYKQVNRGKFSEIKEELLHNILSKQ